MNAINFIKQHGIEKAREVVEGAPERATHLLSGEYVRVSDPRWILDGYVSIADLKCLVKSINLVQFEGGVYKAKNVLFLKRALGLTPHANRLEQAIADYELLFCDTNTGVTVITPKGTSKVKGGMAAFVDMGDDTHIENHISPLCKTESQPVSILESDNQLIERLKAENVAMQARIDELESENKMLHEAAATHLRNQNQFMDLYNRLVEQLYPYAIDLEDPVDTSSSKEYTDGYNRAREIAHYNLLEMMESDVEYICAQCDMLGGGGEV